MMAVAGLLFLSLALVVSSLLAAWLTLGDGGAWPISESGPASA